MKYQEFINMSEDEQSAYMDKLSHQERIAISKDALKHAEKCIAEMNLFIDFTEEYIEKFERLENVPEFFKEPIRGMFDYLLEKRSMDNLLRKNLVEMIKIHEKTNG